MERTKKLENIKNSYIFHYSDSESGNDIYVCKCGHCITHENKDANEVHIEVNAAYDFDFENITEGRNIIKLRCPNCELDFSTREATSITFDANDFFLETFQFNEDEKYVSLYKFRYAGFYNNKSVEIKELESYIKLEKSTNKILFKDFPESPVLNILASTLKEEVEIEINLDKVFPVSKKIFFNDKIKITDNLFDVHNFIGRLANFVSDSKNINIIDELMSQMIGQAGIPILCKTLSIFLGIVCYPNLSTVAMTKGTMFLFDMLNDCVLPDPHKFSDSGATSPLKIFNFLINLKNKEIQKELDSEDHSKAGYVFKSEKGDYNILYDASRFDNKMQISKKQGEVFVRDELTDVKLSPYIFNKIEKFSDYKILTKYLKFIKYNDLINLVMKNDIKLLTNLINVIEFRASVNLQQIEQFIHLVTSYVKVRQNKVNKPAEGLNGEKLKFVRQKFGQSDFYPEKSATLEIFKEDNPIIIEEKQDVTSVEIDVDLNYSLIDEYDFTSYDDSLRMITALSWDPNKEFYKIKHVFELETYHSKLVEHFNLLSNKEKNKLFVDFVNKFKHLENYGGDLQIKIIKTPEQLLQIAKEMKNCAGSYVTRISNGQYVLFMVNDTSKEIKKGEESVFMMGLLVGKNGHLEFDQVKATCNKQGSNRFKGQIMMYLEDKDISYKELADLQIRTTGDESRDMFGYLNIIKD